MSNLTIIHHRSTSHRASFRPHNICLQSNAWFTTLFISLCEICCAKLSARDAIRNKRIVVNQASIRRSDLCRSSGNFVESRKNFYWLLFASARKNGLFSWKKRKSFFFPSSQFRDSLGVGFSSRVHGNGTKCFFDSREMLFLLRDRRKKEDGVCCLGKHISFLLVR